MVASMTLAAQAGAAAQTRQHEGANVTITAQLPDLSGLITAKDNVGLVAVTKAWESMHPGVTVDWSNGDIHNAGTPNNALLVTQASGGVAPDIAFEETGTENSVPAGILANLAPFLLAKDPYDTAYPNWLDTFKPLDPPYMKDAQGVYELINASDVGVAMFYNKAIFARAHISAPPTTYAQWVADLQAIKTNVPGVYPFFLATGGVCDPSWWESYFSSTLLAPSVKQIDVDHQQVLTGLDVATGVAKNIISMKNPAYAEVWKLLGQLQPYLAPGGSQYDACATPGTTTPPLSPQTLMVKGKVAMLIGGSWWPKELASQGFAGKWGVAAFPTVTKATTPYATGLNTTGSLGGPYGAGTWSVTTQKAAHNMTPSTTKLAIDFLEYLTAPKEIAQWLPPEGNGFSMVKGTPPDPTQGVLPSVIVPTGLPPVNVNSILSNTLTAAAGSQALRLVQEYVGGSVSFSAFSSQWQTILTQGAQQWAATAKVHIPGL
jgi:hypothetical protein